ncbi:hypothetical protein ACFVY4_19655 [Streptomyces sp. NPDC058299]|uniref:hypothetical protein n=1 Tax=Streptomyces sp. NPDC058299 TaxID=3346435 RepID=UPI0036ED084A
MPEDVGPDGTMGAGIPSAFPCPGDPERRTHAGVPLRRPLAGDRTAAVLFADEALSDLLTHVWNTGADLADNLPAALDLLYALAAALTRPVDPQPVRPDTPPAPGDAGPGEGPTAWEQKGEPSGRPLESDPTMRALSCPIECSAPSPERAAPCRAMSSTWWTEPSPPAPATGRSPP